LKVSALLHQYFRGTYSLCLQNVSGYGEDAVRHGAGRCLLGSMGGGEEMDLVQAGLRGEQEVWRKYLDLFRVPILFITGGRLNYEKGTKGGDHPDDSSLHLNTLVLQESF
jgi:hypothetical protein